MEPVAGRLSTADSIASGGGASARQPPPGDAIEAAWIALREVEDALAHELPADLTAACRARVDLLVGSPRAAPSVTRGEAVDPVCIDFAEQFVLDVTGIDDAQVDALIDGLGEYHAYHFVRWLQVAEARRRAMLVLRHHSRRHFVR